MTRNYEKLGWTDRNLISANFHFNYLFHENLFGNSRSQVRSSALPVHTGTPAPLHNSPAEWPGPSLVLLPTQLCVWSTYMAGCSSFHCPPDFPQRRNDHLPPVSSLETGLSTPCPSDTGQSVKTGWCGPVEANVA